MCMSLYNSRFRVFDDFEDKGRMQELIDSLKDTKYSNIGLGNTP